jgi:hypothetical protein
MYKAKLESYNFTFEAYAENKTLALEHLKKGLMTHAEDYDLEYNWWHPIKNDIYVIEIKLGSPSFNSCYRDDELLKPKEKV